MAVRARSADEELARLQRGAIPLKGINAMTFPGVSDAYKADPKVAAATALAKTGMSTAPVASGGWGIAEGLSRALSGYLGGKTTERLQEKYAQASRDANVEANKDYKEALKEAPDPAAVPPPAPAQIEQVAQATEQATQPAPQVAPFDLTGKTQQGPLAQPIQNLSPQLQAAAALAGPGPQAAPPPGAPPAGPPPAPTPPPPVAAAPPPNPTPAPVPRVRGAGAASSASSAEPDEAVGGVNASMARSLFRQGIIPIEGGTDPKTGRFRVSPAGAIGPAQLMPGTAPEAMRLAGFDPNDDRWRTDAAVNTAAGQAYYNEMLRQFGDPTMAAAAYNTGPGNMRRTLRRWERNGKQGDWANYLPYDETKKYVQNFRERTVWNSAWTGQDEGEGGSAVAGGGTGGTGGDYGGRLPQYAVPERPEVEMPQMVPVPELPKSPRSRRADLAERLLEGGDPNLMGPVGRAKADEALEFADEMAKQRDENVAQLYNTGYNVQSQTYGNLLGDRYRSVLGDTEKFRDANIRLDELEQERRIALERGDHESANRIAEQAAESRNRIAEEAAKQKALQDSNYKYFNSPQYTKDQAAQQGGLNDAQSILASVREFREGMALAGSGGIQGVPGVHSVTTRLSNNKGYGMMDRASRNFGTQLQERLKGSTSDSDLRWIVEGLPSVGSGEKLNEAKLVGIERAAQRQAEYWINFQEAITNRGARGKADFNNQWSQYINEVTLNPQRSDKYWTYEQWKNRKVRR